MANTLNQTIVQKDGENGNRIVIQFTENVENIKKQKVVYYNNLSVEEKLVFDNFELLSNSIMNK